LISDPRVNDWFLMSGPLPTMCICLTYILIVKVIGPKFMENRKPFELKKVLIYYNAFQVVFSAWLFYEVRKNNHFLKNIFYKIYTEKTF
jgi:elongation of very long chain fatty acids protein 7